MEYTTKDKIEVTESFLKEQITKSWQEASSLQQLAENIDMSTHIGRLVTELLKSISTNYYILIGNLEALMDGAELMDANIKEPIQDDANQEEPIEPLQLKDELNELNVLSENSDNFEPFEYFVDFDEPTGEPITDSDLYIN